MNLLNLDATRADWESRELRRDNVLKGLKAKHAMGDLSDGEFKAIRKSLAIPNRTPKRIGWILSPAYDLNPVPTDVKPRILSTAIDVENTSASLDLALSVADYFDLKPQEAKKIAAEVGAAVSRWREGAKKLGIAEGEIDRMKSAFDHEDLKKAMGLAKPVA
jgi:hypothetical protein